MQNAGPSYQGSATSGVNYSDHTYESQGPHCQSNNYQPYMNATYHPLQSSRSHHYGNHQMHQMAPYGPVHHSGSYPPMQNEYRPNSQDVYRNHHPPYVGVNNNHNMPAKSGWENNAPNADVMQSYNQMPPQQQMMNTPPQMPVNTMRSPPQGPAMNINASQAPVPQHYRQLQAPNDSSHSWPQVQVPSPGVLHQTRTTPSPLSAHVRSPGLTPPFSPPPMTHHSSAPLNVQQHPSPSVVPENDQLSPLGSVSVQEHTSDPLHSLQKMVMLEQEPEPNVLQGTCEMNEQLSSQMSAQNMSNQMPAQNLSIEQQVLEPDHKDHSYPTYLTLGENCIAAPVRENTFEENLSAVLPAPPAPNCDALTAAEVQNSNICEEDIIQSVVSAIGKEAENICTISEQSPSVINTCAEMPHDVQTEVNLNSLSQEDITATDLDCALKDRISEDQNAAIPTVTEDQNAAIPPINEDQNAAIPPINEGQNAAIPSINEGQNAPIPFINEGQNAAIPPINKDQNAAILNSVSEELFKIEERETHATSEKDSSFKTPSIVKVSDDAPSGSNCDESKNKASAKTDLSGQVNSDAIKMEVTKASDRSPKRSLRHNAGVNFEEIPSEVLSGLNSPTLQENEIKDHSGVKKVNSGDVTKEELVNKTPVKVVIHRITKTNLDDNKHTPSSSEGAVASNEGDKPSECLGPEVSNVGPQILILSSEMSMKKFGIAGPDNSNSVITVTEENSIIETETVCAKKDNKTDAVPKKKVVPRTPKKAQNSPRKKRTPASKSKTRPSPTKTVKGRKVVSRKRKNDIVEAETIPKIKKTKPFNGPYVHITGPKENPLSIKVINVAQREEEKDQKKSKT